MLVAIGRLESQKGYTYLLDTMPLVLRDAPDAVLLIAGTGSLDFELRAQAAINGLGKQVRFLGRRDDIAQLLTAADVFVMPSLFERMPLALLEAMAAGKTIVATRTDGITEAIDDGIEGRLIEAEDVRALAQGILEALSGGPAVASWGDAARRRFARDFTADIMIESTLALYRRQFAEKTSNGYAPMTHVEMDALETQMSPV